MRATNPVAVPDLGVLVEPGSVVELRVPKNMAGRRGTVSGYFDDVVKLSAAAAALSGKVAAVYLTVNPCRDDLLYRRRNRVEDWVVETTSDTGIARRRWLIVDLDPVRSSGISSSDQEHEAGIQRARDIRSFLLLKGWPEPVVEDSGNGAYLLYRIDLPNDDVSTELIKGCLAALGGRFNDQAVKVDQTSYNPARIIRCVGTLNAKGDHTPERPHRIARFLHVPNPVETVAVEQLRELAGDAATNGASQHSNGVLGRDNAMAGVIEFNSAAFIKQHCKISSEGPHRDGYRWVLEQCPLHGEDTAGTSCCVLKAASGTLAFSCQHDRCQGRKWHDLREKFEPGYRAAGELKSEPEPGGYALTLDEFIARKVATKPPLMGTEDDNLLPVGGLLILVAKGGKGKTTLSIDASMHLASGKDWLGIVVQRPLRLLIVENEGPMEPFRRKLEKKARAWAHELRGQVFIKTFDWGACTLADGAERKRLRDFIEQERIDLVIGDPLDSLGIQGVGSPAETREFMKLLVEVGLTRDVAFWLLHHPLKAEVSDELDEASGAWGGRPDTMLRLSLEPGNRARLSFPKVRWGGVSRRGAHILGFDPDTEGFEVVAIDDGQERDLLAEILLLLKDGSWRTAREIAAPKKPKDSSAPGIGANDRDVKKILESNPETFVSCNGKGLGRSPKATLWNCVDAPTQSTQLATSGGEKGATALLRPTYRRSGSQDVVQSPASASPTQLTDSPLDAVVLRALDELGGTVVSVNPDDDRRPA